MKLYIISMIFLAAVALAACGTASEQPAPQVPTPSEQTEPELPPAPSAPGEQGEQAAPSEPVETTSPQGSQVESVVCDADENRITFTIENFGERTWNIDQNAPLVGGEQANVKVFVNNYEANRKSPQYHPDTREVMFGPETPFSANCGGQATIAPGDSVQCTLYPVALNRGSGSIEQRGVNNIRLDSPSKDRTIEFTC